MVDPVVGESECLEKAEVRFVEGKVSFKLRKRVAITVVVITRLVVANTIKANVTEKAVVTSTLA